MNTKRLILIPILALSLVAHAGELLKPEKKAVISPEAQAELDKVTQAYKSVQSLELAGDLAADISVGGQTQNEITPFNSTFIAPNKFRHEMKNDVTIGGDGQKIYVFRPEKNDYKLADSPKDRVPAAKYPNPMREILQMQNASLMCALVDDAGKFLADQVQEVTKAPNLAINGQSLIRLNFKGEKMDYQIALDANTHLLRQASFDLKKSLESTGRTDVEKFILTFNFTSTNTQAKLEPGAFAWKAPEGAKDAAAADAEVADANALNGKEAPDFQLNGMDGKPVTLAEQKGSVVILDFWATWCGPCRASLPGLNKIHKELSPKGLKTFAIDLEESKEKIQPVAAKICPDIPVLLDEKSEVSKKFGVSGIPQTVVIGKDGKVKKVFVGSGNEERIRKAVEAALGE